MFCGALVIIGGNTSLQSDTHLSPYGDMDGAVVLANAIHGRLIAGDGADPTTRSWRLFIQIALVLFTVIVVRGILPRPHPCATNMEAQRLASGHRPQFDVAGFLLHPLTITALSPVLMFLLGAAFTFIALRFNVWGVLSASAIVAALSEFFFELDAEADDHADALAGRP